MWEFFLLFYSFLVVGYLWYRYGLIFTSYKVSYPINFSRVSVIVPVYNEDGRSLRQCLLSLINAYGDKDIIVVNDGSTKKETLDCLDEFEDKVTVVHQENKGKRGAQATGVEYVESDIIVTIDSDTIIDKKAILELIKPFSDPSVGGVTGNVRLANRRQNFLTRMISAMYWSSFNIDRKGTSGYSYMPVCSGALSAYRKGLLLRLMPIYLKQQFLGSQCSVGDDRFLTLNIQKKLGFKIKYQEKAVAYTYSPYTLRTFIKQLVRWKQSVIRETFLFCSGARKNKLLFFDVWFNFIMTILSLVIRVHIFYLIITEPLFLINFGIVLFMLAALFSVYLLFYNRREYPYRIGYSILNEIVLWIAFPLALFHIRKQGKWGTR